MLNRHSCNRCGGTGLVANPVLTLLCLAGAVGWCFLSYVIVQGFIENPGGAHVPVRGVRLALFVILGPPLGLIWLAFSNVIKRGCPACTG